MKPELQILGWALTAAVTLLGFVLTRRSATDHTGADLLIAAAKQQSEDIARLRTERDEDRSQLDATQQEVRTIRTFIRQHVPWDDQIYDQARAAGWDVEPPPPLH